MIGDEYEIIKDVFLVDVILLFFGIEIVGGVMIKLIEWNIKILIKVL